MRVPCFAESPAVYSDFLGQTRLSTGQQPDVAAFAPLSITFADRQPVGALLVPSRDAAQLAGLNERQFDAYRMGGLS